MSACEAYRCDFCDQLRPASEIIGVHSITDAFDEMLSYPIEKRDPSKCKAHFCITCYNEQVFKSADRLQKKGNNPAKWQDFADQLSYALRKRVITKVFNPGLETVRKKPGK
jgi:hypothetical protein